MKSIEKRKQENVVAGLIEPVYVVNIGMQSQGKEEDWVREGVIVGVKERRVFLKRIGHRAWVCSEHKV